MNILWMIIIGFVVGILARFLMPGRDSAGFIVTALLGIAGAFVAGYLGQMIGLYQQGESAGLLMSTLGAMLVLFIYKKVARPSSLAAR